MEQHRPTKFNTWDKDTHQAATDGRTATTPEGALFLCPQIKET